MKYGDPYPPRRHVRPDFSTTRDLVGFALFCLALVAVVVAFYLIGAPDTPSPAPETTTQGATP